MNAGKAPPTATNAKAPPATSSKAPPTATTSKAPPKADAQPPPVMKAPPSARASSRGKTELPADKRDGSKVKYYS
eukprot:1725858-Amphidinium_carterae.1